jgi:hypothetical protein
MWEKEEKTTGNAVSVSEGGIYPIMTVRAHERFGPYSGSAAQGKVRWEVEFLNYEYV